MLNSNITNESILPPSSEGSLPFMEEQMKEALLGLEGQPVDLDMFMQDEQMDEPPEEAYEKDFYENLAHRLPESKLATIATTVLDGVDEDLKSRSEWEQTAKKGMKYLGFKLEEMREVPFMAGCRAFDSTFSTALLRFCATARAELFPEEGPADVKFLGEKNDFLEQKSAVIKDTINYYMTEVDREYYPDSEQMLMYVGLLGCGFRKVYSDPLTKRPLARFIDPTDIIINNNCVSLLSSSRITHREKLTNREVKLRELAGFYKKGNSEDDGYEEHDAESLMETVNRIDGIDLSSYEKNSLTSIYESHIDLEDVEDEEDDDDNKFPKPYIVSVCQKSRAVKGVWRNWREGDEFYKRIEYFVQHDFLKGFGLYGYGLTHLAGSNSIVLTSLTRQLIDAGTLKNFPGGLMQKGLRVANNDKPIGPSEFREIETGGQPIQQVVMPLPYNEPSVVLKELRNELIQQTQTLLSTTEMQIAENNSNAPVGTTLALIETSNKVQTSILRSLHKSLGNELTLVYNLFKNSLSDSPFSFKIPGRSLTLSREDFIDDVKIISNSNPKLTTSTQRILQAESELRIAQTAPQLHDLRAAYKKLYKSIGLSEEEINSVLPAPEQTLPLDPITENMNAMNGKPLKASIDQDHQAHIITHMPFAADPNVQAHIKEHQAMQYLIEMQMKMGFQMPDPQMLQDPQVQNQIAIKAAQVTQAEMEQQQQQQQEAQPIDPNEVMMADIAQKREEAILRDKDAHLKAEVEAFKSQQKFETEKMKVEADKEMAADKNEVELLVTEMKTNKQTNLPT